MKKRLLTLIFTFYVLLSLGQSISAGSVDESFNISGTGFSAGVKTLATQTDGKILVGGTFSSYNGSSNYKITRLNTDGSLDSTFQYDTEITGEGIVQVYLGALKILSNGKILIGFKVQTNSTSIEATSYVYRLNTNGSIDASFSTITFKGGTYTNVCDIKFIETLPNNNIIIGGSFAKINGTNQSNLASFSSSGALLTSFEYPNSTIFFSTVNSVKIQSNGKVLVGGRTYINSSTETRGLVRLNSDGSIDNSFNTNAPDTFVRSIMPQDDGKILIQDTKFYRLNSNGTIDTSFASLLINNNIRSIAIQNDGKIIIVGGFTNVAEQSINRIARINSDGSLDSSFDPGTGANDFIYDVSIQPDGKILIGGSFTSFNQENYKYVARLFSVGITYMPDDNFEKYFVDRGYDDILDNYVETSNLDSFVNLTVSELEISDLTGIESFTSLQNLDVEKNNLTSLDVSKLTNLRSLVCSHNQLTSLLLNDNIQYVYARDNLLTSVNFTDLFELNTIQIYNNQLTELDVSTNLKLTELECGNNPLENLDVSNNKELEKVYCYKSNIKSFDISKNKKVTSFASFENPEMTSLNLKNGNNTNFTLFLADKNPKLYCINVDNIEYATNNFTSKDSQANFSLNCNPTPFITKWKTLNPALNTITIPTEGSGYNYTVDWGDGTIESNFTGNATHTYSNVGEYIVKITGDFPRIRFQKVGNILNTTLVEIVQWGSNPWTTMEGAFEDCVELNITATDSPDLSNVTSLKSMFKNCLKLEGNSSLSEWDISNITNLESTFENSKIFNSNINTWDVSSVETMKTMFKEADNFNQNLNSWLTSNVETMEEMFSGADNFDSNISSWNVAKVTNMSGMFGGTSFNQDISSWNVGKVNNMSAMFGSSSFNQELNAWNVSNVTDMSNMFGSSNFNKEIDSWDVSKVINMHHMFANSVFNQDLSSWDVGNVINMSSMFQSASSFNQDISSWNVSNVTNMDFMFSFANNFNQNVGVWNVSNVTTMQIMFFTLSDGLSIKNYDLILQGWASLPNLKQNVSFGADSSKFCIGEEARNKLINNFNWSITDSGKDCNGFIVLNDTNFEQALIDLGYDTNGLNGYITKEDAEAITTLNISNPTDNSNLPNVTNKITDITGIETFINLQYLYCYSNSITNLDVSKHTNLRALNASNNVLESLNIANGNNENFTLFRIENNPNLTCIQVDNQQYSVDNWIFIDEQMGFSEDCSQNDAISNYYTTVPDSDFEKLLIHYNIDDVIDGKIITKNARNLTDISTNVHFNGQDIRPVDLKGIEAFKKLRSFTSSSFQLKRADFSKNINLEDLSLGGTKLDSIDVSMLTKLKTFRCIGSNYNKLKYINVTGAVNLEIIEAQGNEFTYIDVSTNTKLTWLNVSDNQLTVIDVTNLSDLETFACYDNRIKTLDLSNNSSLQLMYAHRNYMEWINIKVGNSNFVADFNATSNPNLRCVQIDNPTTSRVQFFESRVDNNVTVSDSCTLETPKNFITKWQTTSENQVISIQSGYAEFHNFDIDWGDGTTTVGANGTANHAYANPGEYNISLSGNVYEIRMGNKTNLKEVVQWGTNRWKNLQFAFVDSENMQITATDTPDLSLALNLNNMFKGCTALDYNFGTWKITSVIRMPDMLNNTGLSEENYDKTLLGWSQLPTVPRNMQFGAEGVYYCDNEAIKNELINDYNWSITDAGRGCGFQIIAIPDANFEQALIDLGVDTNGLNGNILQSEAEVVESLNVSNKNIADLTGIEAFTALITLNVSNNSLTSLDVSNNPILDALNAERNNIETIAFSENSKMYSLDLEVNNLTSLDVSDLSDLYVLYCGLNTSLSTLDVSNNLKLEWLDCNSTSSLATLILGDNTVLRHLDIDGHLLTSLDVSANTNLQTLECAFGNLSSLTLNSKLKTLSATQNKLSSLNSVNAVDLETIDVDRNSLTAVDFSNNIKLKEVKISDNSLNAIDITANSNLEKLSIQSNNLTQLDLTNNTKLTSLYASENNLNTINLGTNTMLRVVHVDANDVSALDITGLTNLRILKAYQNSLTSLDTENNVLLEELWLSENNLESLNVSANANLLHFEAKNNALTYLNYKNGNNTAITKESGSTKVNRLFDVSNNPNLNCIEVDDITHANEHFTKDETARFKTDCTPRPFITKWKTTTVNESITIPTNGSGYNYTVDWGDGSTTNNITGNALHTYSNAGEYEVSIIGDFPRIDFSRDYSEISKDKIIEIVQWGSNSWTSMEYAFWSASNLIITATDSPDLSSVTSMSSMFERASSFNQDISSWDVSNVTNMSYMFKGASSFNQNISSWDVSKVTDISNMFMNATAFNQPLNSWDVSNVTDMWQLFTGATAFNQPLNSWDVSSSTSLTGVFLRASSFNQDISSWDVSKVTAMSNSFNKAISFNQDISSWDVSNVTDMFGAFYGATKFNQNLSNWNIKSVSNMDSMFSFCGLSVVSYDKTLKGWSALSTLRSSVILKAFGINYCTSETERNKLIFDFGWTITDSGKDCSKIDTPANVDGMWSDPNNWASGEVPSNSDNVTIPAGTILRIGNEISEIKSLENEGTLIINPTYSLKSISNMVNNGTIVMDSDNDDSAVLFIEGTSTGNVVYKRGGLKANKWSLVTPPVSGQKIKEFATEVTNDIRKNETVNPIRYAIAYYDDTEASGSKWKYFNESVNVEETFTAGNSYGVSRATDGAVTFTGTLTTSNTNKTIKPGEWNAIGNPFTTYYPANKNGSSSFLNDNYDILDDNFKGLYIWDATQNKYVIVSEIDLQNRSFPPGQGFFVKVKTGENKIEFKEAKRSLKPISGEVIFQKNEQKYIQLFADNGTHKVATDIKFFNNASLGFDVGLDIGNFDAAFDIYTKLVDQSNTNNYTIQSIPMETGTDVVVPLGVKTGKSEVIFSTQYQNIGHNTQLFLEDKKNNNLINITNSDFKIAFEDAENTNDRFFLHITNLKTLGLENDLLSQINIYTNSKTLFLTGVQEESSLKILNLLGQEVYSKTISSDQKIDLLKVCSTGVYAVRLKSKNSFKTKKIIIK
ncbi:BspA family leucine-rich repeat surface protein [Polaribacter sp. M15]